MNERRLRAAHAVIALSWTIAAAGCVLSDFKKGPELMSSAGSGASSNAGATNEGGSTGATGGSGATSGSPDGGAGDTPAKTCLSVLCEEPPANTCADPGHLTAYDTVGSCNEGECSYTSHAIACECGDDKCLSDPCVNVFCDTPPGSSCVDIGTERIFKTEGACDGGSCTYTKVDQKCPKNRHCADHDCQVCLDDEACGPDCSPCTGDTPRCRMEGAGSECAECNEQIFGDCAPWQCIRGECLGKIGCPEDPVSLRACGDNLFTDCCTNETLTPGVSFNRGNDAANAALLSEFQLGIYEVTVGRFRQFIGSYDSLRKGNNLGQGANPHNPDDLGWLQAYQDTLPATRADLIASLKCEAPNYTWTDEIGVNETKPINCVTWAAAYLFCIWDGSRLPTEAEWNFAAAGGDQQLLYPWGNTPPAADAKLAAYNGYYYASAVLNGVLDIAPVGDVYGGINRFNMADMAGNVAEWTIDAYGPYPKPCKDCANISGTATGMKVVRGGSWRSKAAELATTARGQADAATPSSAIGFRCIR